MQTYFEAKPTAEGAVVTLNQVQKRYFFSRKPSHHSVAEAKWDSVAPDASLAGMRALMMLEDSPVSDDVSLPWMKTLGDDAVLLSHGAVAALSAIEAKALGLPDSAPFDLDIGIVGALTDPNTQIHCTWTGGDGRQASLVRDGAFVWQGEKCFRLSSKWYAVLRALDAVNENEDDDPSVRLQLMSEFQVALGQGSEGIGVPQRLNEVRLSSASRFTLDVGADSGSLSFEPQVLDHENEQLLPPVDAKRFLATFKNQNSVKGTYRLASNHFLTLDRDLVPALTVVKQVQSADEATKRQFLKSPSGYIGDKLRDTPGVTHEQLAAVQQLFVETEAFSERVTAIGLWQPPVLPFVVTHKNTWVPEEFGLLVAGERVVLQPEEVAPITAAVIEAIESGGTEVLSPQGVAIPATPDTVEALEEIQHVAGLMIEAEKDKKTDELPVEPDSSDEMLEGLQRFVVQSIDNHETLDYEITHQRRVEDLQQASIPHALKADLFPHQLQGLLWLQRSWASGRSGALLADDMGLGKTVQTLAFLRWLKDVQSKKKPIMIVAPVALLDNWQAEIKRHLDESGLGEMAVLYGNELKRHKRPDMGKDVLTGSDSLDTTALMRYDLLLTTYQTMRDYNISFAELDLGCLVFDEMQEVKNPKALVTKASKGFKSEFIVGLTGTPIENSLSDLWCLFDTLEPGMLGSLKDYVATYINTEDKRSAMQRLHDILFNEGPGKPALALRRMKSDHVEGLPSKTEFSMQAPMPALQKQRYDEALAGAKGGSKGAALKTLQALRAISLHPLLTDQFLPDIDGGGTYIESSARLLETCKILDKIHAAGEKALLFIESRVVQVHISTIIKQRFNMTATPDRINGATQPSKRQAIVDKFQNLPQGEFAVLVLSPKAAGVGLNITAANHVIHLSRWWNPAVEDQCTDRAYRIGQKKPVSVYIPQSIHPGLPGGSFDEVLHELLSRKRANAVGVLSVIEDGTEQAELFNQILGQSG